MTDTCNRCGGPMYEGLLAKECADRCEELIDDDDDDAEVLPSPQCKDCGGLAWDDGTCVAEDYARRHGGSGCSEKAAVPKAAERCDCASRSYDDVLMVCKACYPATRVAATRDASIEVYYTPSNEEVRKALCVALDQMEGRVEAAEKELKRLRGKLAWATRSAEAMYCRSRPLAGSAAEMAVPLRFLEEMMNALCRGSDPKDE